jgi:DNA-binding transcriptional regulator YiaG
LTPAELRDARRRLGLTQTELALALKLGGDGARTVRRWEDGQRPVPLVVALAIDLMLRDDGEAA